MELVNFVCDTTGERPEEQRNGLAVGSSFQEVPEDIQDVVDATDQSNGSDRSSEGDRHQLGRHLTLLLFLVGCMCVVRKKTRCFMDYGGDKRFSAVSALLSLSGKEVGRYCWNSFNANMRFSFLCSCLS